MKISTNFLRRSVATIIGMLALHSASSHAARCEYVIQNEWGGGFVAAVRITNDTATAIEGWSVSWSYTDGSTRTGGWNANISGSNPYTATGVGWNDRIAPGQTIEFGVMGNKSNGVPAERPTVTGAICGGSTSSEASSSAASSVVDSSSSMDFGSSSSEIIFSSSSEESSSVASVDASSSLTFSSEPASSEASSSEESSSSEASSSSSLIASSVMSSSVSSTTSSEGPMDDHPLDNPFVGARWYVDPVWSAKARAEVGGEKVARFNTAVWMDRIGAIDPAEGFGLRDHLDAALEQGANLIQVVVYDLPNRDCHALASNGELDQGPEGTLRYRTEYIDVIAGIFADPRYSNLRIVAIIEPDSLPNLVTNLSDPDCQLATDPTDGYVANTRYTLNKLSQIPNVYSYVDIGHSGWLGWDDNFGKAITLIGDAIKSTDNGVRSIAGFVSNTAGYTPTHEPFLDALANSAFPGSGGGMQVRQASFYEWNPYFSEVSYVQAWRTRMIAAGFPESIGMLIDTSRNGWGGLDRPTAQSTSTVLDTFVNESRVDRRIHRGNWCNQPGGIGERPQATPAPGVDAYVWVKPPGESDGAASEELSFDPLDPAKGFDRMCDPTYTRSEGNNASVGTGALANAPVAGRWFPEAFQLLVQNAYPALDDVPASSSASSSSAPASSSSVVSSSEESSSESSSSVVFSSEASSSEESSSSEASSSSSLIASSVMSSSVSSTTSSEGPMDDHPLDNPFVGARWYVDPVWSAKARAEVGGEKVARFNTAVWMDRIGAIDPAEGFGLRDHLDAALEQGANLIQVVVYDLPNRDCHALASNGELDQGPEGTLRYRTEYIDVIAGIFADPRYSNLRIVAIIEPDSLPNLVTNLSDPDCQLATDPTDGYVANTRYTLNKLSQIPNVYSYVDIGHSGWLGWDDNFGKAITLIGDAIKSTDNGVRSIAGFVSNTAGYTPTHEPFLDALANSAFPGSGGGMQVRQASFYEWNPYFSEVSYVQAWRTRMIAAGFPESIGMLIDTSRNGWGGLDRPTAQSTSTVLDTFVNESRVDRRIHRGNWCNQPGGIGERPQATPAPGVDAYVWVKPPGESDGAASEELSFDPLDPAKGFDRMCDPTYTRSEGNNASVGTGALANAPVAGRWFPEAFQLLVQNAYPALDDVPASSSASSSSVPASSSSVVSSSEESSSESSSLVASSVDASSSVTFSSEPASSEASSSEASSSEASSSIESSSSELSSSSEASSSVSSSEQSSSAANQAPEANLTVVMSGSTVHVNGRASVDAEGDELTYQIDFGDGTTLQYPEAWHTYPASGSYTVTLTVSDGSSSTIATETVEAQAAEGNHAPVARLSVARTGLNIVAFGSSSFDADNDELSYLWDFGTGDMPGNNAHVFNDCESETSVAVPRLVTLTVFDGELADTQQVNFNQPCGIFEEITAVAEFTWRVEGNSLYVDASDSSDAVYLTWDFGDGGSAVGLSASHTYAEPGTYPVTLTAYGPTHPGVKTVEVMVGQTASSASTSSEGVSSSSVDSSSSSSLSSTSSSSSSSVVAEPNSYVAPRAQTAPEIDGTIDAVWEQAAWAPINVFWLGTQPNPTADDYTGQYKALWDENYLYLLFDITDERLYDHTRDPLSNYWEDDTVEIFIDENKNGGPHQSNTSAWAYHISSYGDVVDYTTSGPHLLNDHIDVRLVSMGDKHVWEMRVRIYGEDYADDQANTPLILTAGKELGFSASYIDNDGNPQRESMMGSVDTPGHRNNQGYLDASVFGSLRLAE